MDLKLILGTAQFGMDYGINNKRGKIRPKEVYEILNYAFENGLNTLDTAYGYGDSEEIIGKFMKESKVSFKIISKLSPHNALRPESIIHASLERLHLDKIHAYLIHDFNYFINKPNTWEALRRSKNQGKIEKIGFSLYYPAEIEYLLHRDIKMDIVQIPYSVFDQRFANILLLLKEKNVEVYARSIFLQGLVFKEPKELNNRFLPLTDKLLILRRLSEKMNMPLSAMCINFVAFNEYINKIIIGVDNLNNLKDNLNAFKYKEQIIRTYDKLLTLKEEDENMILPTNWGRNNN